MIIQGIGHALAKITPAVDTNMSNLHPLMEQILKAHMNPTPLDQTLTDNMKSALSKSAPDVSQFLGWTKGDGTSTEGYCVDDYFDETGFYLGPDKHGIEPIFSPKQFKISKTLSAHFKDGSMWLRHSQRYGDIEIRPRDMNAFVHLWEKHGWQCD